ncbi:PREDICTED: dirigent protein 22-like [Tarenaya hassleriana]|uniref:dirigent protein 22-like n=1 Tax=Tarenaya hassleriana TaxID=28532 RepID=UPI00053C9CF1|nr:PREDICTED: dirigent protein 22-like [Tarenaya hassleriana]
MASVFTSRTLLLPFFILFPALFSATDGVFSEQLPVTITRRQMEKTTRLHFYFHDIVEGKSPTALQIIRPHNKSINGFGQTFVADDPLTEGPELTSKLVGRAQGLYSMASQHEPSLLMMMNFAFLEGIYNGSVLSILARNTIFNIREMPVVGGTGVFRFARGYALAKTVKMDRSGNAVVEYNVTVVHF